MVRAVKNSAGAAVTIASLSTDLLGKGYTEARLVARFNGQQEDTVCTGALTLQFVDVDHQATLASLTRNCSARDGYDQSAVFSIQALFGPTGTSYDLKASSGGGVGNWRWVALEIW